MVQHDSAGGGALSIAEFVVLRGCLTERSPALVKLVRVQLAYLWDSELSVERTATLEPDAEVVSPMRFIDYERSEDYAGSGVT